MVLLLSLSLSQQLTHLGTVLLLDPLCYFCPFLEVDFALRLTLKGHYHYFLTFAHSMYVCTDQYNERKCTRGKAYIDMKEGVKQAWKGSL